MDANAAFLASLEDQVTCHVCLEVFEDPKELPCRHTLCFGCYEKIHTDNKGLVTCPLCRTECRSLPSDIPLDNKVLKFVETYRNFLKQQKLLKSNTKDEEKGNCEFPACQKPSVNKGPLCRLDLCPGHYNKDVIKLKKKSDKILNISDVKVFKVKVEWLRKQVENLQGEVEEVGAVFRVLEKNLRQKKEQLEAELESHLRLFRDELELLEAQSVELESMEIQLKECLSKEDFASAGEAARQLQLLHDSSYSEVKDSKNISMQIKLSELQDLVINAFDSCSLVVLSDNDVVECHQEQSSSDHIEELHKALLDASFTLEQKDYVASSNEMSVNSVQFLSNTSGYFHDTSRGSSYQYIKGYVVKSTKSSLRPLPSKVVIMQSNECKDFLLVHSTVGTLISLVLIPDTLKDNKLLACDSITQSLFCFSRNSPFGSGIYQLTFAGGFLCRLSVDNVIDAAVPSSFGKQEQQHSKESFLAVISADQKEENIEIVLHKVTSEVTLIDRKTSLNCRFSSINLVEDKIYILSLVKPYSITVLSRDSLVTLHTSQIELHGIVDLSQVTIISQMKHIVGDVFILNSYDGKAWGAGKSSFLHVLLPNTFKMEHKACLETGNWSSSYGSVLPNICVYFDSSCPHSVFLWMYYLRSMRVFELSAKKPT